MPPAAASAAATAPTAVRSTTSRRPRAAPPAAAAPSRSSTTASLPARARTAAAAAPARARPASTTPTAPGSPQKTISASSPLARTNRTPPSRPTSAPVTLPAAAAATAKDAAASGSRPATPAATAKAARREEDLSISHRTLTALNEDLAATVRQQADTIALLQSHVAKLERQIAFPAPTAPIVESEVDLDGDAADADHTPDDGCADDEPAVFDHSLVLGRMCVRAERMLRAAQQALIACAPPVPLDPILDDPPPAPRIRAPSVVTSTTSSAARLRASPRPSLVVAPTDAPRVKLAASNSSRSSIQSTDSGIASTMSPGPDAQAFPVAAASVTSASTASAAAVSQRHLQTLLKSLAYHVHLLGTPPAATAAAAVPDRRTSGRKDSILSATVPPTPPPRSRSPVAVTRSGESIVSTTSTATAARRSLGLLGVLGGFAARSRTTSMTAASATGGGASGSAVSSAPPASRHGLGLVLDLQEQREEAMAAPAPPAQDGAIVTQCKDLVLELCRAAGVEMKEVAEMLVDLDPDAASAARRPSGAASTLSSRVQGTASDRGSVILAPPPPHAAPPPMDCDVMFPPRTGKPRLAAAVEAGTNDEDDAESMSSELSLFDDLRSNASSTRSNYSGFTYLPQQKKKQPSSRTLARRGAAAKDAKPKRSAPPGPLRRPSATGSAVPDRPSSIVSSASHPRVIVIANSPPPSDAPTTPTSATAPRGSRRSLLVADSSSAVSGGSSAAPPHPHHAPRSPRALGGLVGSWVGRAGAAAAAAGRSKRAHADSASATASTASRSVATEATAPAPAPRVVKVKSWVA
ncbi:hypothetical protein GGF32_001425 [Allomyces javanicus]|nr:hypothetical protein GGF32_001425 [Allomyces javanicus]